MQLLSSHRHWLRDQKIATKLISSFVLVSFLVIAIGGIGLWAANQLDQTVTSVDRSNIAVAYLAEVNANKVRAERDLAYTVLDTDATSTQADLANAKTDIQGLQASYSS